MKAIIVIVLCTLTMCKGRSQTRLYREYVDSFKELDQSQILDFIEIVDSQEHMTEDEALEFVYNNDSSRLYCEQTIFNMEEEKVVGTIREMYLPSKCLKIETNKYFIIGYTSYECGSRGNSVYLLLHLSTFTKSYVPIDSLTVIRRDDYEIYLNGLMNMEDHMVFLVSSNDDGSEKRAEIMQIKEGRFMILDRKDVSEYNTDDLSKLLGYLGWGNYFN